MIKKQKLELTWIGKDQRPRLEPRILVEDDTKSYHAEKRVGDHDLFNNKLIFGDNLLALKALEQEYAGKVKCVYIDPPYNTGSAFEHYDDGLEHSIWLGLMRDRLESLRTLLSNDGLIFVQIDDNELAYLVVLMDEVFGRANRVNIVCVKMSEATGVKMTHATKRFPKLKEYVLVYKKDGSPKLSPIKLRLEAWNPEYKEILTNVDEETLEKIKGFMDDEKSNEELLTETLHLLKDVKIQSLANFFKSNNIPVESHEQFKWENAWRIVQAVGAGSIKEKAKTAKIETQDISAVLSAQKKLYLFKSNFDHTSRDPRIRIIFADKYLQYNPGDFWTDIKTSGGVAQEGGVLFPNGKKPEALIQRIIHTCTTAGDLVLDSFAGSGTTGAVAHKMGRRWIMIELGEHCHTHIIPRLKKVIDGEDKGGITEAVAWKGGGGFRYYALAPSLITMDKYGQAVINKDYDPAMLTQAMCKLMGFAYAPSETVYWQQGHSTETDFIYVTTQTLDQAQLAALSEEVGDKQSLLICCSAFRGKADGFENLTLKKIPRAVLSKCEWGHDDYSLNVQNLPLAEEEQVDIPTLRKEKTKARAKAKAAEPSLFGDVE